MEPKDQADVFYKVAERARHRFDARRSIEWKIAFAVWTFFGAAVVAFVSSSSWQPTPQTKIALCLVAFFLVVLHVVWELWFLHPAEMRDQRESFDWEARMIRLADPAYDGQLPRKGRLSDIVMILVTVLLAVSFIFVACNASSPGKTDVQRVAIEGVVKIDQATLPHP